MAHSSQFDTARVPAQAADQARTNSYRRPDLVARFGTDVSENYLRHLFPQRTSRNSVRIRASLEAGLARLGQCVRDQLRPRPRLLFATRFLAVSGPGRVRNGLVDVVPVSRTTSTAVTVWKGLAPILTALAVASVIAPVVRTFSTGLNQSLGQVRPFSLAHCRAPTTPGCGPRDQPPTNTRPTRHAGWVIRDDQQHLRLP